MSRPGAGLGRHGGLVGGILWAFIGAAAAGGADLGPLLESARSDPAPKVRLQALRILRKRQASEPGAPDPKLLGLFRDRVESDPHPLVRAFAVRGLGALGTREDRSRLVQARRDPDPFVQEQAAAAIRELDQRWSRSRPRLVVEALVPPEGGTEAQWVKQRFEQALRAVEPDAFGSEREGSEVGVWVQATVVGPEPDPEAPGQVRVHLRVAVGTWPTKNLRHVITTRARAKGTPTPRLAERLVEAALRQAAEDVVAQLRKG